MAGIRDSSEELIPKDHAGRDGDLHQCGDQGSGAEHRLRQRWLGDWMCPAEPGSPVGGLSGENVLYFEMSES